jgi:hypothetical protein
MDVTRTPTSMIVQQIETAQAIQKAHGPDSPMGKIASRELEPLFKLMAERQAENGGAPDWRKWKWYV